MERRTPPPPSPPPHSLSASQTGGTNYRPDLEHAALVRWSKVHRALRVQKGEMKPMTVNAGRKNLKATA